MTNINFPDNPSLNDTYLYGDVTFKFDGTHWYVLGASTLTLSQGKILIGDANSKAIETVLNVDYDILDDEFKSDLGIVANNIDWDTGWYKNMTLTANTTWAFSNAKKGKDIQLDCIGDFSLTIPCAASEVAGEYDGSMNNVIQIRCTDDTPGSQTYQCVIYQTNA
jgi:hypothetical protein